MSNNLTTLARKSIFLAALIQLVNAVDFMIIMPLGPDLARELAISPTYIGYLGGSYTLAAALSSLMAAKFIDNFDRKHVTIVALLGLTLSTLFCGYAWNMESLFIARLFAGLFAGPATSIALAIVTDQVPAAQRGRAMAIVMGAFSVAAIAGVPFGLKMALWFSWSAPFLVVSLCGVLTLLAVWVLLPNMIHHLEVKSLKPQACVSLLNLLRNPLVIYGFMTMGLAIFSTFLIVPNLAAWLQYNLFVPRELMSEYYVVGGIASLVVLQFGGRLIDKLGVLKVTMVLSMMVLFLLWDGFLHSPWLPPLAIFTMFMAFTATRTIAAASVNTLIPQPRERAAFMSLQSVCQHTFSGLAAVMSSVILVDTGGHLENLTQLAGLSMALTVIQPLFLYLLLKKIRSPATLSVEIVS